MDVITETSLAALIQRATDPRNQNPDATAIAAVCGLLNKEPDGAYIATKLIANKIQSTEEWEALQGLSVLEACMRNCGAPFHSEIGKFRFLNEMIKLVSPKYLGAKTPPVVRRQVLQLMQTWTMEYPKETKIKEAYEMLKKQGVVTKDEPPISIVKEKSTTSSSKANPLFQDEEKLKLLQKLLQSKNPHDLQAANRLIKTVVKEDERKTEIKSKKISELETVINNIKLLNEMLDSYRPGQSSADEIELIKELYDGCEQLRPGVLLLAAGTHDNEDVLNQALTTIDELTFVSDKFTTIIVLKQPFPHPDVEQNAVASQSSLLDLSTPSEEKSDLAISSAADILSNSLHSLDLKFTDTATPAVTEKTDLDTLGEIFGSINTIPVGATIQPVSLTPLVVLQPTSQVNPTKLPNTLIKQGSQEKNSKAKAFDDLNVLGENLMKQCKLDASLNKKPPEKQTLNSLTQQSPKIEKPKVNDIQEKTSRSDELEDVLLAFNSSPNRSDSMSAAVSCSSNGDDRMVDLIEVTDITEPIKEKVEEAVKKEIKPLADLSVQLDSIKPGNLAPLVVIEERNGISVTLHFAQDTPREDVSVIVVTTISKNTLPLTNYLFQAVVPKSCKMKLQAASGNHLPAHNPFLPPAAITQIMLIANPNRENVSLKVMISYTMDDETVTEMGEVESLPRTT